MKRFAVALQVLHKGHSHLELQLVRAVSSNEASGIASQFYFEKGYAIGQVAIEEIEPLVGEEEPNVS